jgi:membrane associated rhomboid family serine protease
MTLIIVIITSAISIICFYERDWFERLQFNPYKVYHHKQYYRLVTHAFLHADWVHLIVNMFVLYSFGNGIEYYLKMLYAEGIIKFDPLLYYGVLYFLAIIISSLTTLKKFRDSEWYNSVGASGAVSAILFACIFFNPWQKLLLYAIIPIPGIVFGVLYLFYSHYMSKKGTDHINHDAHLIGALFGLAFPVLIEPKLFGVFIQQLTSFSF